MKSELQKLKEKNRKKEAINKYIKDMQKDAAELQKYKNKPLHTRFDQLFK